MQKVHLGRLRFFEILIKCTNDPRVVSFYCTWDFAVEGKVEVLNLHHHIALEGSGGSGILKKKNKYGVGRLTFQLSKFNITDAATGMKFLGSTE